MQFQKISLQNPPWGMGSIASSMPISGTLIQFLPTMSWLRLSYAWYKHSQFEHGCDLDLRHMTLKPLNSTSSCCGGHLCLVLRFNNQSSFANYNLATNFQQQKLPVTLAYDICNTSTCHGGHSFEEIDGYECLKNRYGGLWPWPYRLGFVQDKSSRCVNQENGYTLKQNFPINFPFYINLWPFAWTYIIHWLFSTPAQWYENRKDGVTMILPESETVDHPRKREEKTQNTDSHNTIKLEQLTQLERTINTPQYKEGVNTKHHTSLRKIKHWIRKSPLYTVCGHLHLLQHLWRGNI